jgi:predicted O-methyltransferase YrrM
LVEGAFEETLPTVLKRIGWIDFVYIDGHHRKDATIRYVEMLMPYLSEDATIVVDDINWSAEMKEAWQQLKSDQRFRQSIDVYMMGLLFTNKALSKENFLVRY